MKVSVKGEDRADSVAELIERLEFYRSTNEKALVHIMTYSYPDSKRMGRYSLTITWEEER